MSTAGTIIPFPSLKPNIWEGENEKEANGPDWKTFLYADSTLGKSHETEAIGYGIERCLYELNPELVCLSPILIHASVLTPAEALIALEAVAAQPNRPAFPVDRHLAAFLISRWKGLGFMDLRDMGKPQREVKNLAVLRILTGVQEHFKVNGLPNLCQWMAEICAPMVTYYNNLKAREHVQEEIAKAVSSGRLARLAHIFENRQALAEDKDDYEKAKTEAMLIESEIKEIESRIGKLSRSVPTEKRGVLGWLTCFWFQVRFTNAARKGENRITQLYHHLEGLLEIWGDSLRPKGKDGFQGDQQGNQ